MDEQGNGIVWECGCWVVYVNHEQVGESEDKAEAVRIMDEHTIDAEFSMRA